MTSTALLKRGKSDGIALYVPKIILKEMAPKLGKLSQHFFLDLVQELSNRTFVPFFLCSDYSSALKWPQDIHPKH
jgi:hypothetical protein